MAITSGARIEIQTSRSQVILRQLVVEDASIMFALIDGNRDHLSQYEDDTAQKYPTTESVEASIKNPKNPKRLRFGIWDQNCMVGSINLTPQNDDQERAEIGYWLANQFTGRGFATVSTIALTEFAKEKMGLKTVFAKVHKENSASTRVILRANYQLTGEAEGDNVFTSS